MLYIQLCLIHDMANEIVWPGLDKCLDTGDCTANDQSCSSQHFTLEPREEGAHRECHSGPHRSAPQTGWPHGGRYGIHHWSHCRPESPAVYIAVSIYPKEKARAGQTYTLALVKARSQFCLFTIEIISGVFFFSSFNLATCVAASVPYAASVAASANFF